MFSCILWLYSRLDVRTSYPIQDLPVSRNFISVAVRCSYGKWYPIPDQNYLIYLPYPRLNCSKTLPYPSQWNIPIYLVYMGAPHPSRVCNKSREIGWNGMAAKLVDQTKEANKKSLFCLCHTTWRRWRHLKTKNWRKLRALVDRQKKTIWIETKHNCYWQA